MTVNATDHQQLITAGNDGKRFYSSAGPALAKPTDVLRWMITRKPTRWPKWLENPSPSIVKSQVDGDELRVTFINHATMLIQYGGVNILTDPVFSYRASPFRFAGPRRHRAAGLSMDQLPSIHAVLISHTHYDHLDLKSLEAICAKHRPQLIAPLNTRHLLDHMNYASIQELDWWASATFDNATVVTMVPALHWTSRKLGDENTSLWGGYVVKSGHDAVYFAGDTGFGDGLLFEQIRQQFPRIRCALLPIGAYEPRWFMQPQHMNPAEAVAAFSLLQAKHAVGIHHGTFQLTDEAHDEPRKHLLEALEAERIDDRRFITLENGQAWDVPEFRIHE